MAIIFSFEHVKLDAFALMSSNDVPLHVNFMVATMRTVRTAESTWIFTFVFHMTFQMSGMYVGFAATWTYVVAILDCRASQLVVWYWQWYLRFVPQSTDEIIKICKKSPEKKNWRWIIDGAFLNCLIERKIFFFFIVDEVG